MEAAVNTEKRLRLDWQLLVLHSFLFYFGFAIYNGVFQNYFREVLRGDELGLGAMECFREIPGLLAALTTGTLVALAESRIAGIGLAICSIGIGFSAQIPTYWFLVWISVFWSIGFHLWSTMQPAIALSLEKENRGGHRLGRLRQVSSIATILALAVGFAIASSAQQTPYSIFFGIAGVCIFLGSVLCFFISQHSATKKRQALVLRREYRLYYWLMFLEGCRRQIFSIFATFVLIKVFNVERNTMLGLMFVNALVAGLLAPQMGRYIDRVGERKPLMIYSTAIIFIFCGYALAKDRNVLFLLYFADNVLFTFSIGFSIYLHRIVRPGELTPSLAMGTTMNHIAAVTLPIIGAFVWKQSGHYEFPFWIGAVIAALALASTAKIPDRVEPVPAAT